MAEMVFMNAYVVINAVNLSDHVREVRLTVNVDIQDITAMGDTFRDRLGGLKDWNVAITFNQDYAAAKVDATLFPLMGSSVAIEIRPDAGAVSATNPKYTGNVIVGDYSPIAGSVGDALQAPVQLTGNGALTRATA